MILGIKRKMLGKQLFFWCMCGCFGALMGPPMVGDGRYVNPGYERDRLKKKMVIGVIFGVEYLILAIKKDDRENVVFGVYGCLT